MEALYRRWRRAQGDPGPSPGRNLQSCEQLSRRIADWGEIPSYDADLAAIRQNHARKSGFWKRMQDIGMAQSG